MPSKEESKFWAVLIGIDYYHNFRSLNGCVRDVENVTRLLHDTIDTKRLRIRTITAESANCPDPPTYSNVKGALEEIKTNAVSGDFMYFHYSGHGGLQKRRKDPKHPLRGSRGGETYEVLILHGDEHFKDYELGGFLDDFARAGVTVFAVLDCCHSGGGDRVAVDTIRQIDEILPPDDDEHLRLEEEHIDANSQESARHAQAEPSYWGRPRAYTVLTACQSYEFAREIHDAKGDKHGALTYTLLKSVRSLVDGGEIPTYKTLFWNILANMRSVSVQNPLIFGKQDLRIFTDTSAQSARLSVVDEITDDQLYINIGDMHGVHVGEEYAVHPRQDLQLSRTIAKIKINQIYGTRASAKILVSSTDVPTEKVEVGCPVSLVTLVIAQALRVKVHDTELLKALEALQPKSGPKVQFLQGDSRDMTTHEVLFQDSQYHIYTNEVPLENCPPFPADGEPAAKIFSFLQDLAQYEMILKLHNKKSNLGRSFHFHELNENYEVFENDAITLELENLDPPHLYADREPEVLHYSVLNLTADWKVELVVPDPQQTTDLQSIPVLPSETSEEKPMTMRMSIPNPQDSEVVDIFKVIVTRKPTWVGNLLLARSGFTHGDGLDILPLRIEDILLPPVRKGTPVRSLQPVDWQTATITIKTKRKTTGQVEAMGESSSQADLGETGAQE